MIQAMFHPLPCGALGMDISKMVIWQTDTVTQAMFHPLPYGALY